MSILSDREINDLAKGVGPSDLSFGQKSYTTVSTGVSQSSYSPALTNVSALSDWVLVMEMLKRGYAVAKMPAQELAEELGK